MILIGLTGGIGHGKTTFAELLGELEPSHAHYESSDIIIEVANGLRTRPLKWQGRPKEVALKDWLSNLSMWILECTHTIINQTNLALSAEDLAQAPDEYEKLLYYYRRIVDGDLSFDEPITRQNKAAHRPLLQWLGGYLAKHVSDTLWFDEIVWRAQQHDVRLVTAGGVRFPGDAASLRNHSPSYIVAIERPDMVSADATDLTERERSLITVDTTVHNNGSLTDLAQKADSLYRDIIAGNLRLVY